MKLKKRIADLTNSEPALFISKNLTAILFGVFAFQLSMFLTGFLLKKSFFIIQVIAIALYFFLYILFKDKAEDSAKSLGMTLFKVGLLIFSLTTINHIFLGGIEKVTDTELRAGLTKVMLFTDLAVVIGIFGLFKKENIEDFFEKTKETSVIEWLSGGEDEIQPGDAVLGTDIDTGKPVRLPLKDRYLHLLALGPTGSGKTSQTILPMVYRDIQNPDLGIIVIEPKSDLAEKVFAMARYHNREVEYFNPTLKDCPYFNPLYGDETDAIENIATTFKMLSPDSPQFFLDMNENLIRNAMKVIKRLYGNDATLLHLEKLIHNTGGEGEKMVKEFMKLPAENESMVVENRDIALWFMQDYFTGTTGSRTATKTYEHCSGVRSQVMKLVSNKYLRRVLNPPPGHGSDIDFDKALEEGKVIAIATAQGKLRDLGRFLGYFIILQLQSSVFRRPGNEKTRRGCMLYIDEFQVYSNPGFEDMLTQGRSYRVASHLATQTRALIGRGGQSGKDFLEVVSTNARNIIVYPGGNADDARYFETIFGEEEVVKEQKGISRTKLSLWTLFSRFEPEKETIKENREEKPRYSVTDIIYKPFGQVFYRIIKNNSIQKPGIAQIEYIPKHVNDILDRMVDEYNESQLEEENGVDRKNKNHPQYTSPTNPKEVVVEDPLSSILDEEDILEDIRSTPKKERTDTYIFFDEEDKNKAATYSDVVELDDEEDIEI